MNEIPNYFIYGETPRPLDVGFLHVELISQRQDIHHGRADPHKHEQMAQVTFWTKGAGTYLIEDKTLEFSAPAISFVPSNVVHGFDVGLNSDAVVVSIADGVLPLVAAHSLLALDRPVMLRAEGAAATWDRMRALLLMAHEEYATGQPGMEKIVLPLVSAVLSFMARLSSQAAIMRSSSQVALAVELKRLIDLYFREDKGVGDYVDLLRTTPHLLAKATTAVHGKGVKELISDRRLLEAKRLLLFTVRTVEDVAYELGFKDPAYFSRFFRQRTGVPPGVWRDSHPEGAFPEFGSRP
ncbi:MULTISPECIES: helix-turn-helix domain-containing protein [Alphaproteobacteria]|uniref:AraC family transcriptional regulator n=2 Tax=Alphaproteobacteria TaxID=28211 RepID=A0A512HJN9_9HYPH|nr:MULTISPECIES: helix-turn-helix domain-containing protein [Alphaproteobacteria]GEO85663.1 AraC family transcriptional regulator [Ciceribacter naphthalenivorans]GLR21982.1 AraC family transcriptional regulator [Ciceribacter naphthalenivorans]GLT04838.1 AraC family transcriptional regulator [Sphingomonas psychrolutea]